MSNEFQNLPAEKQKQVLEAASDMEKPCSPAEVRERLDRTENGGAKNSIKNCLTVFRLDEVLYKAFATTCLQKK